MSKTKASVRAAQLTSSGLPHILVFLNDTSVKGLVDTGAELSIVSQDIVTWANLEQVDYKNPLLIMGEVAEVQGNRVVHAVILYKSENCISLW